MLHENASPRTLGLVRIAVFGTWFFHVLMDRNEELAALPAELLEPAGVLALLPGSLWQVLWTPAGLWALKLALLLALALAALGTRGFNAIAAAACVLLTVSQGLPRSFGFVNHAQIALLYAAYVLTAFPSADGLSLSGGEGGVRRRSPALYRAPLVALTLFFLMTYALVATRRLCVGGPGIFIDDTILYQVGGGGVINPTGAGLRALSCRPAVALLRAGYPVITLFELLSPLCLFFRRFRWLWIGMMVPFHLGTWALMGIFFPMSLLLIAVLLTDLDRVVPALGRRA